MWDIAVLTTTMYGSECDLRFDLACRMVGSAVGHGYRVLIVDDSKEPEVAARLQRLGANVHFALEKGMAVGRRQLFTLAKSVVPQADYSIYLWTEPEKDDLIRHIPKIAAPIYSGEADIVVVGRTEASWATCPPIQVESERRANAIYHEVTGLDLDPMRGPVAFNEKARPFFANCYPMQYGATTGYIQHVAPLEAYAAGLRVVGVNVDFFYPLAQRAQEEGELAGQMKVKWPRQFEECTDAYRKVAKALGLPKK